MQGVKLSQAQRAFDEMNEDSIDKKVTFLKSRYFICDLCKGWRNSKILALC